jgi:hypothetical protein
MIFKGLETKEHLLSAGLELAHDFCKLNKLEVPKVIIDNSMDDSFYGIFYWNNVIYINRKLCRPIVKVPGHDWSFPGFVEDLTPYGIIAHEMGHYISDQLGKSFRKNFVKLKSREENISDRDDKNVDERMAEAARLFITNPDLLKQGRPLRYSIFSEYYTPIIDNKWKTILKNAHPKIVSSAERWIQKNKRI